MKIRPSERQTQNRVIQLFRDKLGYDYLGNWEYREQNANVEEEYLVRFLQKQGYKPEVIRKALKEVEKVIAQKHLSIYDRNKEFYTLLRYGVQVKLSPSHKAERVYLIDWQNPDNNLFGVAEEVTIKGRHTKRPDIVLYLNGIAVGVLELKKSNISISEGIRQNLDNQKKEFIRDFFTTIQLVMAGNDSQGLRYATLQTPERYYLEWKEENPAFDPNSSAPVPRTLPREHCQAADNLLDCDLYRLLNKQRLLEILHDFIIFDRGIKKVPRHSQYFAIKAAQKSIKKREGGIVWHTQGSGKSLIMVWLAKWIKENIDDSRVLIITDREELDEQIEKVFVGVGEKIYRTISGDDLVTQLQRKDKNLICSLIHKFGRVEATDKDYEDYISQMIDNLPDNYQPQGDIYVFVDECHRTQSGKLHRAMKKLLPHSVIIGFTGTPLLKKDKPTTLETFGKYIHTYKFDEGVQDRVILDLRYEARDVDIKVTSENKIDTWFETKTKGLSDVAKAQLKQRWGKLKKLFSSRSRMEKIVADMIYDFGIKPRLATGRGNAMLVAGSIYEACRYYEIFKSQAFDKMAIVTSYRPMLTNLKGETTGEEGEAENVKKFEVYRQMISDYYNNTISTDEAVTDKWIEKFEKDVKKKFVDEPGQMKLLIVVDKLLTGFDAPSATYLYIDKNMRDHGLFQAVCRVNRLDDKDKGDELDKDYGYIVDYRDLFNVMTQAIKDYTSYTSGAFADFDPKDVEGLFKNRLADARKKLDETLEKVELIIEDVPPPKEIIQFKEYFIGDNSETKQQLRLEFYKSVSAFVRAYTAIANELEEAGYSHQEQETIKEKVKNFTALRDELKLMSGDYLDFKIYDPAMRYLIDAYIQAEESKKIAEFEDRSLLEVIAVQGLKEAVKRLPDAIAKNKEALAETIENNIRKLIVERQDVNPAYYEKMSQILKELIKKRKEDLIQYEQYLKEIEKLTQSLIKEEAEDSPYPASLRDSKAKRAIYDNLPGYFNRESTAQRIHQAILKSKKDDWRHNKIKQREVKNAIRKVLEESMNSLNVFVKETPATYENSRSEWVDKIFGIIIKQDEY